MQGDQWFSGRLTMTPRCSPEHVRAEWVPPTLEWMVTSDNLYLGATVDDLSRVLGCHPGLQSGTVLIGGATSQHPMGGRPVCSPSSTRRANTCRRDSRRRGETGRHRAK